MAVGQAREKIRPGDGAGIGVGDVDLELRDHHEQAGEEDRPLPRRHHVAEGDHIHLRRLGRLIVGHALPQGEHRQEGAEHDLEHAGQDPARPGPEHGEPPARIAPRFGRLGRRDEAEEIHLLADLRQQREEDAGGEAELGEVEARDRVTHECGDRADGFRCPRIGQEVTEGGAALPRDEAEGQEIEPDPERLGPDLEPADQADPVDNEGDHHDRADDITDPERQAEAELQRQRHDRRLDGEEQEGEARIDQRGDGGAEVAEAGPTCEEIDVDAVAGGVKADRHGGGEDQHAHEQHRRRRVGEARGQGRECRRSPPAPGTRATPAPSAPPAGSTSAAPSWR